MIGPAVGVLAVAGAFVVAIAARAPIPQDPRYHRFADRRSLLGIPNFWNVVSNVPFPIAGAIGLLNLHDRGTALEPGYFVFFLASAFVGVGSAYYHLSPDTPRLTWDRLPMALAFMAFLAIVVGERVDPALGSSLLPVLLVAGAGSVGYWHVTERLGCGDLRPYLVVQFLPVVLGVLITLLIPAPLAATVPTWALLGSYIAAKVAESLDERIFGAGRVVSGHTLKHLIAAAGVLCFA